jgi:two-component system nitrogen regulation response regulator NtrX
MAMDVLIVDDEGNIRRMLRALLESEGFGVREAGSAEEGLEEAERLSPEVILLDLMLPGVSGIEAIPLFAKVAPGAPVVMISGRATLSDAVEATRRGAFHFFEKPLSPESVLVTVRAALEISRARDLTRALVAEFGPTAEMVGTTAAMTRVRELVRKVAPTDARVLITGESGTGKELAAAAIHGLSSRATQPFIRVNSAAIPKDLVESEMFGHEKGAFTGATERRRGRFELANGGTLFLDEVGDLGHEAQAKLLRALESGEVERVGGTGPLTVDVRVIAATNKDLHQEVRSGRFREDLLFRLEVVPLRMPPLRERLDDVPVLVDHALQRLRRRQGMRVPSFSQGALDALQRYAWPGNVRELMNLVERLSILAPSPEVQPADVSAVLPRRTSPGAQKSPAYDDQDPRDLRDRLEDYERELIHGALHASDGNVAEAGRRLQTDRANLYRRMRRLGIRE